MIRLPGGQDRLREEGRRLEYEELSSSRDVVRASAASPMLPSMLPCGYRTSQPLHWQESHAPASLQAGVIIKIKVNVNK